MTNTKATLIALAFLSSSPALARDESFGWTVDRPAIHHASKRQLVKHYGYDRPVPMWILAHLLALSPSIPLRRR